MALQPIDEAHALQIQAGILGRRAGHSFENELTRHINEYQYPFVTGSGSQSHIFQGEPGQLLLQYMAVSIGASRIENATAISTGALATSEAGKTLLSINGSAISRCKSDLIMTLHIDRRRKLTIGVSTKQCNNEKPTNAQLYFTTAIGFSNLLRTNGIPISEAACISMRQFCGDSGFRPSDDPAALLGRQTDPRRFFWEETELNGREEWKRVFAENQDEISRLLLQKAYLNDPFVPEYLIHKTKRSTSWDTSEVAIYSIEQLVELSRTHGGFVTKDYSVKKGSHKDPPGVSHQAPRFGVIQMQRGGQKQHPTQLQFNLEAGYFYKI